MARLAEELRDPVVVLIEDEFSVLPDEDKARVMADWVASLRARTPINLPVSGAEMVAEARVEAGW